MELQKCVSACEIKTPSKRGQTSVELLLLVAAVAGIVFMAHRLMSQEIEIVIEEIYAHVQEEGWMGTVPSPNVEFPYHGYYHVLGDGGAPACMQSFKGAGSCQ
jgi:hypothetical protein